MIELEEYSNNVRGIAVQSKIYKISETVKDADSENKVLAACFLNKFSELTKSRIDGNICSYIEQESISLTKLFEIYTSFDHEKYVDSIKDPGDETVNIEDTMAWLNEKYSKNGALSLGAGLLFKVSITDSNPSLIVVIIAISLLGLIGVAFLFKRKKQNQ